MCECSRNDVLSLLRQLLARSAGGIKRRLLLRRMNADIDTEVAAIEPAPRLFAIGEPGRLVRMVVKAPLQLEWIGGCRSDAGFNLR